MLLEAKVNTMSQENKSMKTSQSSPVNQVKNDSTVESGSAWSIVYDDFSLFHLDGNYVSILSSGSYFMHSLSHASQARESVFSGQAPVPEISRSFLSEIGKQVNQLDFSQLKSPPEKTLLPDQVITKLFISRTKDGKLEGAEIHYLKESSLYPLNDEVKAVLSIVRSFEVLIAKTKPAVANAKIQNPIKRLKISKEAAVKIAIENGFSATRAALELRDTYWLFSGRSKSSSPPMLIVVSAFDGAVHVFLKNSEVMNSASNPYSLLPVVQAYDIQNLSSTPSFVPLTAVESNLDVEKFIDANGMEKFDDKLEIQLLDIQGIEYERAQGGKITGIKTPIDLVIPLILRTKSGKRSVELRKTKSQPQPSIQWNRHRVTFVGIYAGEKGFKVKLRAATIPSELIDWGTVSATLRSGDELLGPDGLEIFHKGYVGAHTMNISGQAGTTSSCLIKLQVGSETKNVSLPSPMKVPVTVAWKKWILTFTKADPDGGMMSDEKPVEFKIEKNLP